MQSTLTIEDLAESSGLSLRTLRYYMSEGLLPGPDTAGKYASYSQEHLDRLAMIQRLKKLHLPLKEIRHLLENMTEEDMGKILKYQDDFSLETRAKQTRNTKEASKPEENLNALEYIRELEKRQTRVRRIAESPPAYSPPEEDRSLNQEVIDPSMATPRTQPERWTKIILAEGVELNIREPLAKKLSKEIGALAALAEKLFGEKGNEGKENE